MYLDGGEVGVTSEFTLPGKPSGASIIRGGKSSTSQPDMDQSAFRSLLASASSTVPRAAPAAGAARVPPGGAGTSRRPRGGGFPFRGRGGATRGGASAAVSGPSYRDRAAERRKVGGDEPLSTLDYQQSKFLGGDLEHTHLVKGVDFALLAKMRRATEAADESALDAAMEAAAGAGAGGDAGMDFEALDALLNSTSVWAEGIVSAALAGAKSVAPMRASTLSFYPGRTVFSFDVNHVFDGVQDRAPPLIILRGEDDAVDESNFAVDALPASLFQEIERVFQEKKGARNARKTQARSRPTAAVAEESAPMTSSAPPLVAALLPTAASTKPDDVAAPIIAPAAAAAAGAVDDGDYDDDIFGGIGDYAAVAATRVSDAVAIAAAAAAVSAATASSDANAVRAAVLAARGRADVIAAHSAAAPSFEGDAVASSPPAIPTRIAAQRAQRVPHHLALDADEIGDADALDEWDALEGTETLAEKKRRLARDAEDAALAASKEAAASRFTARFASNADTRAAYARRSGTIDPLARGGISGGIQDDASGSYGERYDRDAARRDDYTRELVDEDDDAGHVISRDAGAAGEALKPAHGAAPTLTASGRDAFAFAGLQQPTKPRDSAPKRARAAVKLADDSDVTALRSGNLHMLGGDSGVSAGGGFYAGASFDTTWRAGHAGDDDERGGKKVTKKQKFSQEHAAVMKLVEEKKG